MSEGHFKVCYIHWQRLQAYKYNEEVYTTSHQQDEGMTSFTHMWDKDLRPSKAPYGIDDKLFSCNDLKCKKRKKLTSCQVV